MKLPHTYTHPTNSFERTTPINHNETTIKILQSKNPSLKFIRFQWQDYSGVLRSRIVPIHHCLRLSNDNKSVEVPPSTFERVLDNTFIPECNLAGTDYLLPCWDSAHTSAQSMVPEDSYATVMCEVVRTRPASLVPELDLCPRLALAKVMHKAMEVHGLSFLVKFEVEVEVVKVSADGNEIIPHSTGFGQFAIAGQGDPCFAHMEECICELQYVGIDIEGFQLQGRRGRYQISLHPQQPLQAVDELLLVHDRIKRIFSKYSYIATMCPKPVAARQQTTSQHMHISISPPDAESSFLAGVLKHLQALCAFSLPYDLSYEREQLNSEVVAWGTQNWGVPIRKVNSGHWDIRCVDATANMYLTLAAFLGAGLSGIQNQESLIWPDISISERLDAVKAGPAAYLPSSLEDALCFLEAEAGEIEGIIESKIVHHYVLLKRFESSRMRQDLEEARRLHVVVF